MAIDDNTSYELTGAQVKDLANKIKGKAADNIFVGATSAAPGSKGLVPQPQAGGDSKLLKGDGSWGEVTSANIDWSTFTDDSTYFTIGNLLIQFGMKDFGNQSYNNAYWGSVNRSPDLYITFPRAFSGVPYYVDIRPIGAQQMAVAWSTYQAEDSATRTRGFNVLVPSSQTGTLETKAYWLAIGPA